VNNENNYGSAFGFSIVRYALFLFYELRSAKTTSYWSAVFRTSDEIGTIDDVK
jgi:hypothetical protein